MFGQYILKKGYLCSQDLDRALLLAKFRKKKIGRLLVELGFISKVQLDALLIGYLQPFNQGKYEDLKKKTDEIHLSAEQTHFFDKLAAIPITLNANHVEVLVREFKDEVAEQIEEYFGCSVTLHITEVQLFEILTTRTIKNEVDRASIVVSRELNDDQKLSEPDPFAKLLKNCLECAKALGASDIHFEPYDTEYLIRFRVHGHLNDWKRFSVNHTLPLTSKLKWIINMDLGLIGQPQDSRATFHSLGIDIRGSSMPVTSGGEKIVLRLQYQEKAFNIRQLGIREQKLNVLLDSVTKSDGLILISGPTGSGKTTTLYALLEEMDRLGKNISTLENPVEKQLARVNQANIKDYKDFVSFQRALMRQDPDVILLGEIRDTETAELALKLASTGHLVLSTIHANGAVQVIDRLTNLGADSFSIKTNLRLSVAQRLLRKICQGCSQPALEDLLKRLENPSGNFRTTSQTGCSSCFQGVTGRIAVIEYIGRDEVAKLGIETVIAGEPIAYECLQLARSGLIDIRDALFFS
ncbi:MAG: Flp pilus assembly complex ATPase component TadA [Oligoflexales bacterium]|nr:Flp pilus assembly complex ATPase component TadA [Oligoflexales bacterium]